ncbi:hypothetical protein ADUPG1_011897, partial [Aduncisulcus paluster]
MGCVMSSSRIPNVTEPIEAVLEYDDISEDYEHSNDPSQPVKSDSKASSFVFTKHAIMKNEGNKLVGINDYTFKKKLGKGTFSIVMLATCPRFEDDVAIKMYNRKKLNSSHIRTGGNMLASVRKEISIFSRLDPHENVVSAKEVIDDPRCPFICLVLEVCTGGTVHDYILKKADRSVIEEVNLEKIPPRGPISDCILRYMFLDMIKGLLHLHQHGIVHRDLKPENFLIVGMRKKTSKETPVGGIPELEKGISLNPNEKDKETMPSETELSPVPHIKLTDMSVSEVFDGGSAFSENYLSGTVGTPAFLSPETLTGVPYPPNTPDVWSLGVSFFFLLTGGLLPFFTHDLADLHESIATSVPPLPPCSPLLFDLMCGMLCKDPVSRLMIADVIAHPFFSQEGRLWDVCDGECVCGRVKRREKERLRSEPKFKAIHDSTPSSYGISIPHQNSMTLQRSVESKSSIKCPSSTSTSISSLSSTSSPIQTSIVLNPTISASSLSITNGTSPLSSVAVTENITDPSKPIEHPVQKEQESLKEHSDPKIDAPKIEIDTSPRTVEDSISSDKEESQEKYASKSTLSSQNEHCRHDLSDDDLSSSPLLPPPPPSTVPPSHFLRIFHFSLHAKQRETLILSCPKAVRRRSEGDISLVKIRDVKEKEMREEEKLDEHRETEIRLKLDELKRKDSTLSSSKDSLGDLHINLSSAHNSTHSLSNSSSHLTPRSFFSSLTRYKMEKVALTMMNMNNHRDLHRGGMLRHNSIGHMERECLGDSDEGPDQPYVNGVGLPISPGLTPTSSATPLPSHNSSHQSLSIPLYKNDPSVSGDTIDDDDAELEEVVLDDDQAIRSESVTGTVDEEDIGTGEGESMEKMVSLPSLSLPLPLSSSFTSLFPVRALTQRERGEEERGEKKRQRILAEINQARELKKHETQSEMNSGTTSEPHQTN